MSDSQFTNVNGSMPTTRVAVDPQSQFENFSAAFKAMPHLSIRQVRDGERLSGHGNPVIGYPEIYVCDGKGPGGGSMMFAIVSFHWADVVVKGNRTELWFENKQRVVISDGIVQYAEAHEKK